MTTGGTFQRDQGSYVDQNYNLQNNQILEQDKLRASGDLFNQASGAYPTANQAAINKLQVDTGEAALIKTTEEDESDSDDPSDLDSANSSEQEDFKKDMVQLREQIGGRLSKEVKTRYLMAKKKKVVRDRLQHQICQEFAYDRRVREAFNLDETRAADSDSEGTGTKVPVKAKRAPSPMKRGYRVQPTPTEKLGDSKEKHGIDPPVKAKDNKNSYLRNYAIEFELPSKVVKGAKIYRKDPRYIFQVLNYLIPKSEDAI